MNATTPHAVPPQPDWLAIDVGGANLKAADGCGWCWSQPFAMWQAWKRLTEALTQLIGQTSADHLAVTMTGEIADCFASRALGVEHIVTACTAAAAGRTLRFYSVSGDLLTAADALARPLDVAAANWHALARLAASLAGPHTGMLLDIGSTTTDIVPLVAGHPAPSAWNDWDRLAAGELVYTGIERTPVPAIVRSLPYQGRRHPVASECFATARDAWLTLGGLSEQPTDYDTADGQPATKAAARTRLARTLLLEPDTFTAADASAAAAWITEAQTRQLARALARVTAARPESPQTVILSGHGEPLAQRAVDRFLRADRVISLPATLGPAVSRVAPAHALARIARGDL